MKQTILIVEDERKLAELHRDYLRQDGHETCWLDEGAGVVAWVRKNAPALILLDLMLPGKDGLEICKEIRRFSNVPIIMVTARVEEIDRLLGLNLGADDYICKPFSPREVVARVKAVLRRSARPIEKEDLLLRIDNECYQATLKGRKLDLTAVEFQLISILSTRPGQIFSRDQLMDRIYTDHRIVCDRTIDSHIKKLRKKIAAVASELELIHSVYGVGYKYEEV
ncbi:DNA-binding response regulator [Desulfoluna limicola]|uniref:DNA-binding response regulator n=1 Tax=Desulfoluna limicola TaxID=2810562 RepID=A0ABM7PDU6_9BACT|nr:response regulator [Desulfoluna limicola]BCS95251.1 DNA-binding response regulator [Desulfoluna limicola]